MSLTSSLLPTAALLGESGLHIGGCDLIVLADEFGTPLLVYDEDHLRSRFREAMNAFPDGVSYASTAFLCAAMARLVHQEGLHLDVASGGELEVALAAGIPGAAMVMHGNNKSSEELGAALVHNVSRIVVDSDDEVRRLRQIVKSQRLPPPGILIRVNPSVRSETHSFVSTGHAASTFGFRIDTGHAARVLEQLAADPRFNVVGIHVHVGSQLLDLTSIGQDVSRAAAMAVATGLNELSVGGGLGVAYTDRDSARTFDDWSRVVHLATRAAGFAGQVLAEPGRSLAATAGVTVASGHAHAMSSNYNKLPRPAVVFVSSAGARLVVRRETAADMMRTDCLLEPCQ
jgi:diaminopimelate decarboxylase